MVEIWRAAVDATHDFLTPEDRIEIDEAVQGFLPSTPLWVAVDETDQALGFMMLEDNRMEALFIDSAYHRQGIGRALVDHALQLQPAITTEVNEQNPRAVGFYEHLGFVRTGRREADDEGRPYPLIQLQLCR
jgi:putative acetyltransferase